DSRPVTGAIAAAGRRARVHEHGVRSIAFDPYAEAPPGGGHRDGSSVPVAGPGAGATAAGGVGTPGASDAVGGDGGTGAGAVAAPPRRPRHHRPTVSWTISFLSQAPAPKVTANDNERIDSTESSVPKACSGPIIPFISSPMSP